jgi:hypothetical protein
LRRRRIWGGPVIAKVRRPEIGFQFRIDDLTRCRVERAMPATAQERRGHNPKKS